MHIHVKTIACYLYIYMYMFICACTITHKGADLKRFQLFQTKMKRQNKTVFAFFLSSTFCEKKLDLGDTSTLVNSCSILTKRYTERRKAGVQYWTESQWETYISVPREFTVLTCQRVLTPSSIFKVRWNWNWMTQGSAANEWPFKTKMPQYSRTFLISYS